MSRNFILLAFGICMLSFLVSCKDKAPSGYLYPFEKGDFKPPKTNKKDWRNIEDIFERSWDFLNDYELTLAPDYTKKLDRPGASFGESIKAIQSDDLEIQFLPLNQDLSQNYQYTHRYICKYYPEHYHYANIAYPNPCKKKRFAKAKVELHNKSESQKEVICQMFFQNTSYWYPTDSTLNLQGPENDRTNYFGCSNMDTVVIEPGSTEVIYLDYIIGKDPKDDSHFRTGLYGPARPGAYEFMLWLKESHQKPELWADSLVMWKLNPFAELQKNLLSGDSSFYKQNTAYVPGGHFRFKLLNETFDGSNMLDPGWIYFTAEKDHKPLCDTCSGDSIWNCDIIQENWSSDDFFKGDISKSSKIKVPYGNRDENVVINKNGVFLRIPGSKAENKQKTWGEWKFMPEFHYGKAKIVAKLAPVRNDASTPTGVIHNIWLYQKRHRKADAIPGSPYATMLNDKGKQPYEIDIEIWSKIYEEHWKNHALINYSIVDYFRDTTVAIKPSEELKLSEVQTIDRFNNFQLNFPHTEEFGPDFFEDYHLFEIEWDPKFVKFFIDGELKATITDEWAKIPDQPCNLWINSPIYQDGTYYTQSQIPFFEQDKFTHIRYISIE